MIHSFSISIFQTTFEPPVGIKFPEFKRPGVFLRSQRVSFLSHEEKSTHRSIA